MHSFTQADLLIQPVSVNIAKAHQKSISQPTTGFIYIAEEVRFAFEKVTLPLRAKHIQEGGLY